MSTIIKKTLYNWFMDGTISYDYYIYIIRSGKMSKIDAKQTLITDPVDDEDLILYMDTIM